MLKDAQGQPLEEHEVNDNVMDILTPVPPQPVDKGDQDNIDTDVLKDPVTGLPIVDEEGLLTPILKESQDPLITPLEGEKVDQGIQTIPDWMSVAEDQPTPTGGVLPTGIDPSTLDLVQQVQNLKAQVASLSTASAVVDQSLPKGGVPPGKFPDRLDYGEDDEAFSRDIKTYMTAQIGRVAEDTMQRVQRQEAVNSEVVRRQQANTEHGNRVSSLLHKYPGVTPIAYQSAEQRVKSTVRGVSGATDDNTYEAFVQHLGEGSENVMLYLGRDTNALNKLSSTLRADPTGLSAMAYLGSIRGKLGKIKGTPVKSRAPKPGIAHTNQGTGKGVLTVASLRSAYTKAHKDGNVQRAVDIKFKAKGLKVDTSAW